MRCKPGNHGTTGILLGLPVYSKLSLSVTHLRITLAINQLAPPLASLAADLGDKWEELSLDMATLLFGLFVIKALTRGQERKKCTRTCKCLFVAIVCTDSAPLDCELFWLTSGRGFPWIN